MPHASRPCVSELPSQSHFSRKKSSCHEQLKSPQIGGLTFNGLTQKSRNSHFRHTYGIGIIYNYVLPSAQPWIDDSFGYRQWLKSYHPLSHLLMTKRWFLKLQFWGKRPLKHSHRWVLIHPSLSLFWAQGLEVTGANGFKSFLPPWANWIAGNVWGTGIQRLYCI